MALFATPACAHPHVWVTARSQILFAPDGKMTGVRHEWTFDEGFSTYAVEGLERKDGKLTQASAEALAKLNVESLVEFDYFTFGKSTGKPLAFASPVDYSLTEEADKRLTLHFTLPLKAETLVRTLTVEVYDPTFYVDFEYAKTDPVTLSGAPAGCTVSMRSSGAADLAKAQTLSESFFSNLSASSTFGSQFANRALVACP